MPDKIPKCLHREAGETVQQILERNGIRIVRYIDEQILEQVKAALVFIVEKLALEWRGSWWVHGTGPIPHQLHIYR